jgi:hypothetical protein
VSSNLTGCIFFAFFFSVAAADSTGQQLSNRNKTPPQKGKKVASEEGEETQGPRPTRSKKQKRKKQKKNGHNGA